LRAKKVAFFLTTSGIELKKGLAAGASRRFSKKKKNEKTWEKAWSRKEI
jgi:hypothetical protein